MRKPLTHVLSFQVFLFLFFLFLSLFSGYIGFIKYKEPFFGLFGAQESRILLVKDGTTKEDTWRLFIGWHKTCAKEDTWRLFIGWRKTSVLRQLLIECFLLNKIEVPGKEYH